MNNFHEFLPASFTEHFLKTDKKKTICDQFNLFFLHLSEGRFPSEPLWNFYFGSTTEQSNIIETTALNNQLKMLFDSENRKKISKDAPFFSFSSILINKYLQWKCFCILVIKTCYKTNPNQSWAPITFISNVFTCFECDRGKSIFTFNWWSCGFLKQKIILSVHLLLFST